MKTVETKNAPEAIGPYSQAKITGGLVFASGQIPVNPASGNIEADDVAGQTEQVCKNVAALLEAAGSSIDKVVKTVCFLADIADFAAFNAVYEKYFTSRPARSCVAVKDIPKGALVEIECIAEL
ncbi:MAG TPA: regulator [Candidatus Coproplasma stercoripullorum]|uniref:Regulator n=1 Tax=Candidatus Coproplasma stercoripullorum TaxID=2840751 RepID=A0A9D1DB44_9FIRM|nr:regulator [Candidatus Coproplasma stercoripullorum]